MTLPSIVASERLTLPLWGQADAGAIRGGQRLPAWHADFPREDDRDAATLWVDGDPWGPRYIARNGTVIGSVGFFGPPTASADDVLETEVGYGLVAEARGWGFASEALKALLALTDTEQVRIRASVEPTNKASLRVLAKCGFTELRGANEDGHLVMARPVPSGTMAQ
ncbi:MAG: GNAT family N-acetyltransferase [Nocardioides sp.]|nr:GNAT family N-acetyltransferase [Nocardioides sp.]